MFLYIRKISLRPFTFATHFAESRKQWPADQRFVLKIYLEHRRTDKDTQIQSSNASSDRYHNHAHNFENHNPVVSSKTFVCMNIFCMPRLFSGAQIFVGCHSYVRIYFVYPDSFCVTNILFESESMLFIILIYSHFLLLSISITPHQSILSS